MSVNKTKPNSEMYPGWDTWTPLPGCLHDCIYCYAHSMRGYDMTPRFRENYLRDNLGIGRKIFICSMGDIGGKWNNPEDVKKVLAHCCDYDNLYLVQSKDPGNLIQYIPYLPDRIVIGTTIEMNRNTQLISKAPIPSLRMMAMVWLKEQVSGYRDIMQDQPACLFMISMEPLLDFDPELIEWIRFLMPDYVSIGLDSKNHHLSEPAPEKILHLIKSLRDVTEVKLKANLRRLIPEHELYNAIPGVEKLEQGELKL